MWIFYLDVSDGIWGRTTMMGSNGRTSGGGLQGFIATFTIRFLKELGIHGPVLHQTITQPSHTAERCSQWLWVRRKTSGTHPLSDLTSLWWLCLSRGCHVIKSPKHPITLGYTTVDTSVANICWCLVTYHQASVEDLETYKGYSPLFLWNTAKTLDDA